MTVTHNGTKYFATADLLEIGKDRAWLVKMTTAIDTHWKKQNGKKCRYVNSSQNGHSSLIDLSEPSAAAPGRTLPKSYYRVAQANKIKYIFL